MTKDEQIKDLQAELERTAKYAEKVTRERDIALRVVDMQAEIIKKIESDTATIPHLGEIR